MNKKFQDAIFLWLLICVNVFASPINEIQEYLDHDEDKIDIGIAALILSKDVYPDIDVNAYSELINQMVKVSSAIESNGVPLFEDAGIEKINVFLYMKGPWNGNWEWKYETKYDDSVVAKNNWLPYYIDNRLGNCVSMPTLWLAIGQRMGLPVYGSLAPKHMFVKFDNGVIKVNVETTGIGGNMSDSLMMAQIENANENIYKGGSYYRKLSKKEYIAALMVNNAVYAYREKKDTVLAKRYLELAIKYNPKMPEAYFSLYYITKEREYYNKGVVLGGITKIEYSASYTKWKESTK